MPLFQCKGKVFDNDVISTPRTPHSFNLLPLWGKRLLQIVVTTCGDSLFTERSTEDLKDYLQYQKQIGTLQNFIFNTVILKFSNHTMAC